MTGFFQQAGGVGCLAVALLLGSACATATGEPVGYAGGDASTTRVQIATAHGTVPLYAEIAATPGAHTRGLMGRAQLAPDAGMLFVYSQAQDPERAFWMYRTRIALDVAFLDADGRILSVVAMEPCRSRLPWRCPRYVPGVAYWAALEVNRGFFSRHRIDVGDHVILPKNPASGRR